jgi:hypothetical protein
MSALRRYAIPPPTQFNDRRPVPPDLIADTLQELEQAFGVVSCETQTIQGLWYHEGELYQDSLARVFVDVEDTAENRQFFIRLKDRLKNRFQQKDIWLTTYPIEVIGPCPCSTG